jgi:pilus assembly protein Flp/PilA
MTTLMSFLKDESGQSMVEYGITLGGVAAVSYISVVMMGDRVADLYAWMANHLPGGENGETGEGQVRLTSDGLVALEDENGDGQLDFADRNGTNFDMVNTLGSNNAFNAAAATGQGWLVAP